MATTSDKTWKEGVLGDLVSFQRGFDITKAAQTPGPYWVISSSGPQSTHAEYKVKGPGVVVGRKGTLGNVFYSSAPFWPHDTTLWVKDFHGNDERFVYYFLQGLHFERYDVGASNPTVNRNHVHLLRVRYPGLREQVKIAAILSAYDHLVENNLRRIKIVEDMARAIYREWFVEFRAPGVKLRTATPAERKITGRDIFPDGWHVTPLGEVVDDIVDYRGKTPTKLNGEWAEVGIPAISALNVKGGRLVNLEKSRYVSEDLYTRWMKNPLKQGDILMTSEAPLGELFFLCREERYCLSQRLYSIRANRRVITPVILYLNLESDAAQHELSSRATGATVGGIRQSELRRVPIVVPPRVLQDGIEPTLSQLAELKATLEEGNANLRSTRDFLLPRLMSGEVSIDNLEILTGGDLAEEVAEVSK